MPERLTIRGFRARAKMAAVDPPYLNVRDQVAEVRLALGMSPLGSIVEYNVQYAEIGARLAALGL
jgi:hypothetical protein